jgi:hypothetical protein
MANEGQYTSCVHAFRRDDPSSVSGRWNEMMHTWSSYTYGICMPLYCGIGLTQGHIEVWGRSCGTSLEFNRMSFVCQLLVICLFKAICSLGTEHSE